MWENNWSITLSLSLFWPCLSRYFHNLQSLSLAYCQKFTDKGLQYLNLGNGCHKLIYLDLSGCIQVCLSVSPSLQQASTSSGGRAASSPHVPRMLCTAAPAAARFAEVLSYTAALALPRVATIGSWLPSTGCHIHKQPELIGGDCASVETLPA